MLLVIESREDLAPIPTETRRRSTEQALRAMDWPFPVDHAAPVPRRALPIAPRASNVIPLRPVAAETRRPAPRPAAPLFGLELAEAN